MSEDPQPYMGYRDLLAGDFRLLRNKRKVVLNCES